MALFNFVAWLISGVFGSDESRARRFFVDSDISTDAMAATPMSPAPTTTDPVVKPMWQQAKEQVASLQKVDPDFSDIAFLEQANQTYQKALTAENDMNASELGAAATQNFVDSLSQCITQWQSSGVVRKVTDVKLDPPTLFKVSVDGTQQQILVRFTGQAARYKADASSGVVVDGSKQPDYFTEFAAFVRPAGTTTPKSVAAGAPAHCPGCGAPMQPGAAVCPYCSTPLTGTSSTWQIDKLSASPYV
jgi:predicted lipid-binding transport protein (Tim44 family)